LWAVVVLLPSEEYSTDKNTGSNLIWNKWSAGSDFLRVFQVSHLHPHVLTNCDFQMSNN
jgi:hypothetical protein